MSLDSFDAFLAEARRQEAPERLLLVFAAAELPERASEAERAAFAAGHGGALSPLMCTDKAPGAVANFAALVTESEGAGPPWAVLFAAVLPGEQGRPPARDAVEAALQRMVDQVKVGEIGRYLAFNRAGETVELG